MDYDHLDDEHIYIPIYINPKDLELKKEYSKQLDKVILVLLIIICLLLFHYSLRT